MTAQAIPTSGSLYADLQSFIQQTGAVGASSSAAPEFVIFEIVPNASSSSSTQDNSRPSNNGTGPNGSLATNASATSAAGSDSSGSAPISAAPDASDTASPDSTGSASTLGTQFSPSTLSALVATQENSLRGPDAPNTSSSSSTASGPLLGNLAPALSSSLSDSSNDTTPSYYVSPYTTGPDTVTAAELQAVGLSPTSGKGALLFGQPTPLVHGVSLLDLIAQGNIAEFGSPTGPTAPATSAEPSVAPPTQAGASANGSITGTNRPSGTSDASIQAANRLTPLTSLSTTAALKNSDSTQSTVATPNGYASAYQLLEQMIQLQARLLNSSGNNNAITA